VRHIFDLYTRERHTLDSVAEALYLKGIYDTEATPRFPRSKLYAILRDRAYVGEVCHRGAWSPGSHEPLVDRATFARTQVLLGGKTHDAHESVYGSLMMRCGHCGQPVVAEVKTKQTRQGERIYRYYRCARYCAAGHPRVRLRESDLDHQLLTQFGRMQILDPPMRQWIKAVLRERAQAGQQENRERMESLQRQLIQAKQQKDRLLNIRLVGEIDGETFTEKQAELRRREAELELEIEASGRQQSEKAKLALKVFELSQSLVDKWLGSDIPEKRQLLEIVCLNLILNDATLGVTMRKPFDRLAKGLKAEDGRGDGTQLELFLAEAGEISGAMAQAIRVFVSAP